MTFTKKFSCKVSFYAFVLLVRARANLLPNNCPDNGVDVTDNVVRGTGVSSEIIWSSKAFDVIQCWRFCVQRKPCKSLTYDYVSKNCFLSKHTLSDGNTRTGSGLLYSEFDWFAADLEPDCYGRPCGEYEVCVPGLLASGNADGCSYTCLKVSEPSCPLPEWLNGPRTPGSVNSLSCNVWETGGGTATCGNDLRWSAVVTKCKSILNFQCQDDTVCEPINAQCASGTCACADGTAYDSTENMCVAVCGPPPTEANTVYTINEDGTLTYTCAAYFLPASLSVTLTCQNVGDMKEWSPSAPDLNCYNCGLTAPVVNTVITTNADGSVTYTCSEGYFPTDASLTSETLTCNTDGTFSPSSTPTITCYNCADSPPDVPGATYNHVPGETIALYTCGSGLRQHPDTTSMEAVCVYEADGIGTWNYNIECYGVRLVDGEYSNSGFLEVFKGGKWNVVCYDDRWDWRETSVVCKEINPALYQFGGAFHVDYYDKTPVNNENRTRLKDPDCSGSEEAVILCASTESCGPSDTKLGITCYTDDVTATGMYFALGDDPSFVQANVQVDQWYAVWVRYNGTWGRVCSDGFGNDEEDVVCKTVNSAWRGDHTGEDDVIAGQTVIAKTWDCDPATPHFLYCGNKGYNYDSQSCTKVVTVECRI